MTSSDNVSFRIRPRPGEELAGPPAWAGFTLEIRPPGPCFRLACVPPGGAAGFEGQKPAGGLWCHGLLDPLPDGSPVRGWDCPHGEYGLRHRCPRVPGEPDDRLWGVVSPGGWPAVPVDVPDARKGLGDLGGLDGARPSCGQLGPVARHVHMVGGPQFRLGGPFSDPLARIRREIIASDAKAAKPAGHSNKPGS
jgi:hypothetical protein